VQQGSLERQPLPHAARELADQGVLHAIEPDTLEPAEGGGESENGCPLPSGAL
jgi:hypothetical protein